MSAWSFWRRRNAAALSHHGVRMIYDPEMRRAAALVLGITFTVLGVAGAFILSWFKPAGQISSDSALIADRASGQIYVMVDGRLHPALNLASARLIAGQGNNNPTFVTAAEISKYPAGPTVGIPGAPSAMPIRTPDTSTWTLCDTAAAPTPTAAAAPTPTVTLISGPLTGERAGPLPADAAILATYNNRQYVITGGHRSEIDPADKAVTLAVGLDAAQPPLPISQALFDAIPAAEPLASPTIEHVGDPPPYDLGPGVRVGTILLMHQPDQFYVALTDGVQRISPVVVAALRASNPVSAAPPMPAPPDKLIRAPAVDVLPVGHYPAQRLRQIDTHTDSTTCLAWSKSSTDRAADITILSGQGLPIPTAADTRLVRIIKDAAAPVEADQVYIDAAAVNTVTVTGAAPDAASRETLWWISDQGVRYGIELDDQALKSLGIATAAARQAPWVLIRTAAPGPELSRADALTQHDSLTAAEPLQAPH